MNDQHSKLHERLTRATAAQGASSGEMDVETAQLREAWLAFGDLLQAVQSPAHVVTPNDAPIGVRLAIQEEPSAGYGRWRSWLPASWMVSASLLAAAMLCGRFIEPRRSTNDSAHGIASNAADSELKKDSPNGVAKNTTVEPKSTITAQNADAQMLAELAWDDELDEGIATLADSATSLWYADDARTTRSTLYDSLDDLNRELQDTTL